MLLFTLVPRLTCEGRANVYECEAQTQRSTSTSSHSPSSDCLCLFGPKTFICTMTLRLGACDQLGCGIALRLRSFPNSWLLESQHVASNRQIFLQKWKALALLFDVLCTIYLSCKQQGYCTCTVCSKLVLKDEGVRVEKRINPPVRHRKMPKSPGTKDRRSPHSRSIAQGPARPIGRQSSLP